MSDSLPVRGFRLPPWIAPAVLLCFGVPIGLAQVGGTATRPVGEAAPDRTLLDWYFAGGMFMHPIALCSLIALAIVVERLIALRRSETAPPDFLPKLRHQMADLPADRDRGLALCQSEDHALARIVAAGIRRSSRGIEAMEKAMEDQGASEAIKLRRNMRVLFAIASVATLLGLIGTIQGMIFAFREAEVIGTGKFAPLARGIYTALVTTFAGLLVAIPVTVAYYFLAGRIEKTVSRLNDAASEFLDYYTTGPTG